jgi:hypothetical protein
MKRSNRITCDQYKVAMRGGRWKYFPTLEAALEYERYMRARTGVFAAVVAYRPRARK